MNTEVNTDNVALTQRLSSKTTKNYYTGGTFPAIPSREELQITLKRNASSATAELLFHF